nr:hypothetical protein Iba_scaffold11380CG0610 [Ipomoea batatas]
MKSPVRSFCQFFSISDRGREKSLAEEESSSRSSGFHVSMSWASTLTACPISGRRLGSLVVQCPANSAMMQMLLWISSFAFRAGSIAAISFSLFDFISQNHSTKYRLSSGRFSSSVVKPVRSSIKTTPKLKTSTLVVIFPVTEIFRQ